MSFIFSKLNNLLRSIKFSPKTKYILMQKRATTLWLITRRKRSSLSDFGFIQLKHMYVNKDGEVTNQIRGNNLIKGQTTLK